MPLFKDKKLLKILLAGFISGFLAAIITIFISDKLSSQKINTGTEELNLIIPYNIQKTYEPESFNTPNILYSTIIKKSYRIPIITYHYVENVKDPGDTIRKSLNIIPFVFDKEMQALSENHYQTIFTKDIPKIISNEIPYASKSVALTFDDGYEDFYTDAFPILKKYKLKATIFVVYNFIGQKGFMSEKQIKELIDSHLVEVGGHTMDHVYLKLLPKNIVINQVTEGKKALEKMFKIKIESFAYPYGVFDKTTIDAVRSAGYTNAVSEISDIRQSNINLLYLSRIRAGSFSYDNIIKFLENYKNK